MPAAIASVPSVGMPAGAWLAVGGMSLRMVPWILRWPPLPVAHTPILFVAKTLGLVPHLAGVAPAQPTLAAAGIWALA